MHGCFHSLVGFILAGTGREDQILFLPDCCILRGAGFGGCERSFCGQINISQSFGSIAAKAAIDSKIAGEGPQFSDGRL
jgi:hypothetical protein